MTEPTAIAIVTPEERAAREREGADLMIIATELVLDDPKKFATAGRWLREVVVPLKRTIMDTFRPRIEQAHALHKGLVTDEKRFLGPVEDAERIVRGKLATYEQAEARRRREAEAAAQRERERLEREARSHAEADQRRLHREAEDRRLAEAADLEARGDRDGAARLIEAPISTPVVSPTPVFAPTPPVAAPPKVAGIAFRDIWHAELVDLKMLVQAVARGEAPITLLKADQAALDGMARSLKGALTLPGVRAVSSRATSVRTA